MFAFWKTNIGIIPSVMIMDLRVAYRVVGIFLGMKKTIQYEGIVRMQRRTNKCLQYVHA